jgi:hypothetical protein
MAHRLNLIENVSLIVPLLISSINGFYQYADFSSAEFTPSLKGLGACRVAEGQTAHDLRDGCAETNSISKTAGLQYLRFDLDEIIAWTKAGNNK